MLNFNVCYLAILLLLSACEKKYSENNIPRFLKITL